MTDLGVEDYPIHSSWTFKPSHAVYIREIGFLATSFLVFDLPQNQEALLSIDSFPVDEAKKSTDDGNAVIEIKRASLLSRVFTAYSNDTGLEIASISGPYKDLGRWTLKFTDTSCHSIQIQSGGTLTRADAFVRDSVAYFWDKDDDGLIRRLYKVRDNERIEIATYKVKNTRDLGGVLVWDAQEVDRLVAVMTCVSFLKRSSSFRK